MTINEYHDRYADFKCPLGEQLMKYLVTRANWGKKLGSEETSSPEELVRVCGNMPDVIPLEYYIIDPQKALIMASESVIRVVMALKLEPTIEEKMFLKQMLFRGYSSKPELPLAGVLTINDRKNKVNSLGSEICDVCERIGALTNGARPGFDFILLEEKQVARGTMTMYKFLDCRRREFSFGYNWGVSPQMFDKWAIDRGIVSREQVDRYNAQNGIPYRTWDIYGDRDTYRPNEKENQPDVNMDEFKAVADIEDCVDVNAEDVNIE